jgi:hypothetical protein
MKALLLEMRAIARSAVVGAGSLVIASCVASCGGSASTKISDCLKGSLVLFEEAHGSSRTYQPLRLEVTCSPAHPFALSEIGESGDEPVLALERGGRNTCLHRLFRAKGENCLVEVFFDPRNPPGEYYTFLNFKYAGEFETYTIRMVGYIAPHHGSNTITRSG